MVPRKQMMLSTLRCCGLVALFFALAAPAASIVRPQTDTFQDGTTQNWIGGASPVNVPSGGPDGAEDRFLRISATNGNLGTNNIMQWTGNYTAADVAKIEFNLNNLGPNPLALRITLFGAGGTFTTTNETVLPPGSGWVSVDFALDSGSLTQTAGFGTLAQTLADVNTLLIRHDPDPISPSGQENHVTGVLGIDNVTALPEPSSALLRIAGIAAFALIYRARHHDTGHGRDRGAAPRSCR